ncbi:pumilio homolog 6, chloroplastic [Arachis duranensis]|uniref:Pumilio homolog 6, chloroplastic n=1 Tax=Arachis duranensis TaxID=130453 RepID=A0A6P4D1R6_ARADU|nr:pumilio homolog 6, chloroplastic [Arachis duranensis]XP_015959978.1 pumilio homolog 6, chloroplastic [Arachis duranensis]XP_015959980.1 pumilio homolog 6, chloroplastic [Arachis duranensis]XP_015959981.1 pumilio homolog 6, chloroplastic [Arachis duranensis]
MATESPIRISEAGGKWPSLKEGSTFGSPARNMATEDLGILVQGHRFHGSGRDMAPNRSGSAPPSMEGSFLAIENLLSQQNTTQNASLATLSRAMQKYDSEEQLRADPAYLAYYNSNVNLNPRLPPPLISRENRHHISNFRNNWGFSSADDSSKISFHLPQGSLATHREESEDDSLQQPYDNELVKTDGLWSRPDASASLPSQCKNIVDSIQEDFPHTMLPVYSNSHSVSRCGLADEPIDLDAVSSSSRDPTVPSVEVGKPIVGADDMRMSSSAGTNAPLASSSSLESTGSMGISDLDVSIVESQLKALSVSNLSNSESPSYEEKWKTDYQNNLMQQQMFQQQNNPCEVPNANSQNVNSAYIVREQFPHNASKFSSDVQPLLQSSGFTPPLYATAAAAYMTSPNPFYTNLQASGMYTPQYVGGYTINPSVVPSYIPAYPPHGAVPYIVDGATSSSYTPMTPGLSAGGSISHGAEMTHANKFPGQYGFTMQPSFTDPMYMQYHQQPFVEGYGVSGHFDPMAPRASGVSQISPFDSQKRPTSGAYLEDKNLHHQRSGANMNLRRGGLTIPIPNYFGPPTNMGYVMQYPSSPLPCPVLPGYPEGSPGLPGVRNEMKLSPASGRNGGVLSGWQGHKSFDSAHDPKIVNFLEELKSGKGRRFELSDIIGHIVEFSADQHGSRFIQQKLESCSVEEKALVFKEVLPHASKLMTDVFGNYVIQKFFEYGSPEQRRELASRLGGQILPLSLQMYGCRVIQKALEVIELEQKAQLVRELDGHVMRCVRDQNGNHVIQKCIESIPTKKIAFIISAFRGQVAILSMHPYGCRVIQRVLEHCTDEIQCQFIVDEILESVYALAQDQYGNYVTQHVLERGKAQERSQIISKLSGHIVQLSQHKFASNVIEKCLEYGDATERELLISEIIGHEERNDNLLIMMKDQFANYVIQKVIDICSENQRVILLSHIRVHAHALKKYTYGKHIVARLEQQFGEDQTPRSG